MLVKGDVDFIAGREAPGVIYSWSPQSTAFWDTHSNTRPPIPPKRPPAPQMLTARGLGCAAEDWKSTVSSWTSESLSSLEIRPWTSGDGVRTLPSSARCVSSSGLLSPAAGDRLRRKKVGSWLVRLQDTPTRPLVYSRRLSTVPSIRHAHL